MNAEERFDELINALKVRKFRLTPQRVELVRMIASSEGHPSAAQLYANIKSRFPTMSQATVYKTLKLLKEMNQVYEIDLHDDSHYDGNLPFSHPHLVCNQCKKIMDGEFELDQELIRSIEKQSGFQIMDSQVIFFGLCSDCRKANR